MFNSVIKESCFKNLKDIIPTYVHDVNTLLSHNQLKAKTKGKKAVGTRLSNNGKEKFYLVFLQKVEAEKVKMATFLSAHTPLFYQL